MNLKKIVLTLVCIITFYSCVDYKASKSNKIKERQYYSSTGFALIYEENLYKQKVVNKKINNTDIQVMHNFLDVNTPIQILNPVNLKTIKTKIYKKANYPKIFNAVVSKKIASILELDFDNPFIEINEIKKNKTFVAKKANTYEEEKNVAGKAPVNKIIMDDLTSNKKINKKNTKKNIFLYWS